MKYGLLVLLCLALVSSPARAQGRPADPLRDVDFEQHLGAALPLNVAFRDEAGRTVRLASFFGEKPVVLVLAYYDCPNLCTLVLNALLESARDLRLDAKRDYEIVIVSIRPGESTALAAAKKQTYTLRYGRPGTADGWHFLTGDEDSIQQLAHAVGFRYVYDPASNQFAHASGIVVATPLGKVSRYFFGIEYPPKDLRLALIEAGHGKLGTLADRLLLLCFHYSPQNGRYSLAIARLLQIAGGCTVLCLGFVLYRAHRPRRIDGPPSA
jgi:protein SCO1/2